MTEQRSTVYRDGGRIRRTDSLGYGDRVSDDQIREHIASNGDPVFKAFAEAVLAIRAFERVAASAATAQPEVNHV